MASDRAQTFWALPPCSWDSFWQLRKYVRTHCHRRHPMLSLNNDRQNQNRPQLKRHRDVFWPRHFPGVLASPVYPAPSS